MNLEVIKQKLKDDLCKNSKLTNLNYNDVITFTSLLKGVIFPNYHESSIEQLHEYLIKILKMVEIEDETIINDFYKMLIETKEILKTDLEAFMHKDPALKCLDEVIYSYLTFDAILIYRVAHILYQLNVPYIPRMMTEYAHSKTGVDINPGASIGHHFFIDHGTGIVIGETSYIGNYVSLYQGVTLGAISLNDVEALKGVKRHPTIEDNVTIYANATILGGNTIIGKNTIIGASCFITKSIKANSKISFKAKQ